MNLLRIAIDGPTAAGKGTLARNLAERLGITYVDTGAMYRVAALLAQRANVDWQDAKGIAALVEKAEIELRKPREDEEDGRLTTVVVDSEDVSNSIRTPEMDRGSSIVSTHGVVREVLVEKQRQMAENQSVVIEGRDIGLRVLPEADIKLYLTADIEERARRRYQELLGRGQQVTHEEVEQDVRERDEGDMSREVDPLQKLPEAIEVDTTGLSIAEVVDLVESRVRERIYGGKEGQAGGFQLES